MTEIIIIPDQDVFEPCRVLLDGALLGVIRATRNGWVVETRERQHELNGVSGETVGEVANRIKTAGFADLVSFRVI